MVDEEKRRVRAYVEIPPGMELSKSRKSKDGHSALLRSTDPCQKSLQTHAEIFLEDEVAQANTPTPTRATNSSRRPAPSRRELSPDEKDLLMLLIDRGTDAVLNRLERFAREWWAGRPARRADKARRQKELKETAAQAAAAAEQKSAATAEDEAADEVPIIPVTLADWQSALNALLLAHPISSKLWEILAYARVEDADETILVQQKAMTQLTPQEFEDRKNALLEANPGLADQPTEDLLVLADAPPEEKKPTPAKVKKAKAHQ